MGPADFWYDSIRKVKNQFQRSLSCLSVKLKRTIFSHHSVDWWLSWCVRRWLIGPILPRSIKDKKMSQHTNHTRCLLILIMTSVLLITPSFTMFRSHSLERHATLSSANLQVSTTFSSSSLIGCAVQCLSVSSSVYFFLTDSIPRCHCGVLLLSQVLRPEHQSELQPLYGTKSSPARSMEVSCLLNIGFQLVEDQGGSVPVCIQVGSAMKTYADAEAACERFQNGRLFKADSITKLSLLRKFAGNSTRHGL